MTVLSRTSFNIRSCLFGAIGVSCPILVSIIKNVKGCSPSPIISKNFFWLVTWLYDWLWALGAHCFRRWKMTAVWASVGLVGGLSAVWQASDRLQWFGCGC